MINSKQKLSGGLHIKAEIDDVIYVDHQGSKLKIHYHGQDANGNASLSFVGSKDFLVAREKVLKKMGIL